MAGVPLMKWGSLVTFCFQNAITPIVFRLAMTEAARADRADTSVILFFTETMKMGMSLLLLFGEESFSVGSTSATLYADGLQNPRESLQLAVPAVIYALQNALLQWSSAHLSAALWQVTYQGKILVTAFFSVVLLGKQIKKAQWLAILVMGAGIAIVQLADAKESKQKAMGNADEQRPVRGFFMLVLAASCSGFASVFTEMVFKQVGAAQSSKKKSVWLQNMQLAFFSQLVVVATYSAARIGGKTQGDFLQGFTLKTWMMAFNNAVGGLLVALVIKHADNILRGFASAAATILCALLSVFIFGFMLKPSFGLGTLLVLAATLLYGNVFRLPGEWWNSEFTFSKGDQSSSPPPGACGNDVTSEENEATSIIKDDNVQRATSEAELTNTIGRKSTGDKNGSTP